MAGTVDSWLALGSAIYARLAPPLGSAFYDSLAPQGGTPPYTVWQVLTTTDDYSWNANDTEELEVQIRTVSNSRWPGQAKTIYGTAHAYMQSAPLNVQGFKVLHCERTSKFNYMDAERFWHVGGIYRIVLQKT